MTSVGRLLAVSAQHVHHAVNRAVVERLRARSDDDWLLVAGDVGEGLRRGGVGDVTVVPLGAGDRLEHR